MAEGLGPEGALGWTRLGCATTLLTVLPLWGGLVAALIHMWGPDWPARFGLQGPATWLGISLVTWVAMAQATLVLVALGVVVALGLLGWRVVGGWLERRSARASARRYDALVGDGGVLRPDSWALTDGPEPEAPSPDDEDTEGE